MNKKLIKWLLQIIVTIVLLYFALERISLDEFKNVLKGANYYMFLVIPVFLVVDLWINSYRVYRLYSFYGVKTKLLKVIHVRLQGIFFALLFPSIGDFYKIQTFKNIYGASYAKNSLVVFLDRLIFLLALLIVLTPVWLFDIIEVNLLLKLMISGVLIVVLTVIYIINKPFLVIKLLNLINNIFNKKVFDLSVEKREGYALEITKNTILAVIRHVLTSFLYLAFAYALMPSTDFKLHLFILTVFSIIISRIIPLSVGGIGLREYIAVMVFPQIGVAEEYAFAIALIVSFVGIFQGLAGGISYIFNRIKKLKSIVADKK